MNRITPRPDAFSTIVRGGLTAGVLDAADAVIAYGILGTSPIQVLQYVASGLLGNTAFAGNALPGVANAGLGAALHFLMPSPSRQFTMQRPERYPPWFVGPSRPGCCSEPQCSCL